MTCEELQAMMAQIPRPSGSASGGFSLKTLRADRGERDSSDAKWLQLFDEKVYEATSDLKDMVFNDQTEGIIFPGELLWSQRLLSGNLIPVRNFKRLPCKATITSVRNATGDLSFEYSGEFSNYSTGLQVALRNVSASAASLAYSASDVQDSDTGLLQIGLSARYLGSSASNNLRRTRESYKSIKYISLEQKYFSVVLDTPYPCSVFPEDTLRDETAIRSVIAEVNAGAGELAYVSRVTYGRKLILCVSSEMSSEELDDTLRFSYSGMVVDISGGVTAELRSKWRRMSISAVIIGGKADENLVNALTGSPENLLENINRFLSSTVSFDEKTVAVPISFQARYWRDNGEFIAAETSRFSGEEIVGYARKSGEWSKRTKPDVPLRIGPGADIIRGDGEMDTGDSWVKLSLEYKAKIANDKSSVSIRFIYRAEEWTQRFTRQKDSIFQASKEVIIPAPDGRPIEVILSPRSGIARGNIQGKNHGFAPFDPSGIILSARGKCDAGGGRDNQITECLVEYEIECKSGRGPLEQSIQPDATPDADGI